jgi:ribosomal protein L16/L10AE
MLKIVPYPHQIIREHKRVNVAQADRFQEGMKKAYGKPAAVAARVDRRDDVFIARACSRLFDKSWKQFPIHFVGDSAYYLILS